MKNVRSYLHAFPDDITPGAMIQGDKRSVYSVSRLGPVFLEVMYARLSILST
jgi:hypothetical protein